jgi:hypothetical protein
MKAVTIALLVAIALPLAVHQSGEARLKERQHELAWETGQAADVAEENDRCKKASREPAEGLSGEEAAELARLRNEISQYRNELKESNRLAREIGRLEAALKNSEGDAENPTALLVEEIPVRRQRLNELNQWLEENPGEKIAELGLLSEDSWIRSAYRQRVTDEEMQEWMVAQRSNAQVKFAEMTLTALRDYAANNNRFPTDLAELLPYLKVPADPAMLDGYEIVPASSLPKFLREAGEDWVITPKSPVNERDARVAVGLAGYRATFQEGRWGRSAE